MNQYQHKYKYIFLNLIYLNILFVLILLSDRIKRVTKNFSFS